MNHKFYQVVFTLGLAFILVFGANLALANEIDAKSAPGGVTGKYHPRDMACVDFLEESFESWFPAGWTRIITNSGYTWNQTNQDAYDGVYSAMILYDPALVPQNEWMISPQLDLSSAGADLTLDFWFLTSYYWHVDPYDNGDMEIRVSLDGGNNWSDPLWTEDDYGVFDSWTWYSVSLDFSDFVGESNFKVALVYEGSDGAQANFDAILLSGSQQLDHDAGVVGFLSPGPLGDPGLTFTPEITVGNFGPNTETFTANLIIELNSSEVYNENVEVVGLEGNGATLDVEFPDYTPTEEAIYVLTASVILDGDQNSANNTRVMTHNTMPIVYYDEDFEDGNGGFAGDNDWQYGAMTGGPGGGHSGTDGWGTILAGQYSNGPLLSVLTSPEFELGDEGILSFWHWYETESTYDGGNVKISTNGGGSWTLITSARGYDGPLSSNFQNPIGGEEAWYGDSPGWVEETFDLSMYSGEDIIIKLDYGADNSVIGGDGWYFDDFHLEFYDDQVDVDEEGDILPRSVSLEQNYPNPFNARTSINFTIPVETEVELTIFNSLGQIIETLVSNRLAAGAHSINWDASDVSSGTYFYKLSALGKTEIRTLTLIK